MRPGVEEDMVANSPSDMRKFWDQAAQENAAWYVDTSCDYDAPDMEQFFRTGTRIVDEAFVDAPVQPSERHLAVEIGSGLGRVCSALAQHFERVIGVDISSEMVKQAQHLVDDPRIEFLLGSGSDLHPVSPGSADLVVTFTVFQHLPNRALIEGYIDDAARVLKSGGILAAQWNNLPHPLLWKWRGEWWRLRQRLGLHPLGPRVSPQFHGIRVPLADMEAMLDKAGFVVKGTKGLGTLFAWVWAEKR
jgi:SAM-dependent methyltransferase